MLWTLQNFAFLNISEIKDLLKTTKTLKITRENDKNYQIVKNLIIFVTDDPYNHENKNFYI